MEIKNKFECLVSSEEYKEWAKEHQDYSLSSVFIMLEGSENIEEVQFGFCDRKGDKITSFVFDNSIKNKFDDEVFRNPDSKVSRINLENVKIDANEALAVANESNEKFYPSEFATKKMLILQYENGEQWNVTFITKAFNMINFRIDAVKGNLISHEKKSLLQLGSNLE